jgi:hypothetical protein
MLAQATTCPGTASVAKSVRESVPPKQQFVGDAVAGDREEVELVAVGSEDAHAVVDGRGDVETTTR